MTSPHNPDDLLAGSEQATAEQRRRLAEVHAREHVGAAGWAQSTTLEDIIRAGKEGLVATEALRRVVSLTGEQLRALPLGSAPEAREGHSATLRGVLDTGRDQLVIAHHVNDLVRAALEEVTSTPLTEISVDRLRRVQDRVREQVAALHAIIASAHAQADTLDQVQQLDQVLADHQDKLHKLHLESQGSEAGALAEAGEDIVQRIGELDDAAPEQLGALQRIGTAVAEHVGNTAATPEEKVETLEQLSEELRDRADDIRRG